MATFTCLSSRLQLRPASSNSTPTGEELRLASGQYIREELPKRIRAELDAFIDASREALPRRIRYLGTEVASALVSLAALNSDDPVATWALSKFDALALLETRYPNEDGPSLARQFYDSVRTLYMDEWDHEKAIGTFRDGLDFLRWVAGKAEKGERRDYQPCGTIADAAEEFQNLVAGYRSGSSRAWWARSTSQFGTDSFKARRARSSTRRRRASSAEGPGAAPIDSLWSTAASKLGSLRCGIRLICAVHNALQPVSDAIAHCIDVRERQIVFEIGFYVSSGSQMST